MEPTQTIRVDRQTLDFLEKAAVAASPSTVVIDDGRRFILCPVGLLPESFRRDYLSDAPVTKVELKE